VTVAILPPRKLLSQMQNGKHACWQKQAPNPDKLMAGRLQAYAPVLRQLHSIAGSPYKSAKTGLNWVSKGIKLNIVPVLHSSHDKALQWHRHVRIVKHMLANTGKDNGVTYLEGDKPSPVQFQPQVSRDIQGLFAGRGSNKPEQGVIA